MPRTIKLLESLISHNVPYELIKELHYNDLLLLNMRFILRDLREHQNAQKMKNKKTNKNIKKISGAQAAEMLLGGPITYGESSNNND